MSIDYDYYLTTKHREDSEKIKAHLIELLKERLSVDVLNHIHFTNINRDNRFGIHFGVRGPAVFEVSDSVEDTASFFPDIQMRFEIGLDGPVEYVEVSKNGELVQIYPWIISVHAPSNDTYNKLLNIISAKDLPEMKQNQKEYSVYWQFDKETEKEQTKHLLEEISRQMGDIKLLAVYYNYLGRDDSVKDCIWICNGEWQEIYGMEEALNNEDDTDDV